MEKCKFCGGGGPLHNHHIIPGIETSDNKIKLCIDCHFKVHHPDKLNGNSDQFEEYFKDVISRDLLSDGWGIMPRKILYNNELTSLAKLMYCELSSLSSSKGYCWPSNSYLSDQFNVTERTIRRALTELEPYLIIQNRGGAGRLIFIHKVNQDKNVRVDYEHGQKCPPLSSTTSIESLSSIKEEEKIKKKENIQKKKEVIEATVTEVIDYLNLKANKRFNSKTEAHRRFIRGRLTDVFKLDDFKKVIDKKVAKWTTNQAIRSQMNDYLRPETLFCAKHFESYLNESEYYPYKISGIDYTQVNGIT